MPADEIKIPRVYLTDPSINRKSAHHTLYAGPCKGELAPGEEPPMYRLEFEFGVARQVPKALYDRFADLGHVTTDRPRSDADQRNDD